MPSTLAPTALAWFYRRFIHACLFQLNPERAHHLALWGLARLARMPSLQTLVPGAWAIDHPLLHTCVLGLPFANPVGLAAGFDKNAIAVDAFPALGFGFVEVGTVTPQAQPGNPPPRLFRLPADEAVINRLGFNNDGAAVVGARLRAIRRRTPVGVNIGKNAATPLEQALADYVYCLEQLYDVGDYLVLNVSSPNTPGLRHLQAQTQLIALIRGVQARIQELARASRGQPRPLLVKIAPDLTADELDGILEAVETCAVDGIIATNTTVERSGLHTATQETGGLSGQPLGRRATEVIRYLYQHLRGRIPIIGVGGIFSAEDAYEKICAGAALIQLYTGLIYRGPDLPSCINAGLVRILQREGFRHLSEAVGSARS
jgi:dihydroorotate dehydrogenase